MKMLAAWTAQRRGKQVLTCSLSYVQAFKQKIKHLLYEHGRHIEQLKADADAAAKIASDEFQARESLLQADKRGLQTQLREQARP